MQHPLFLHAEPPLTWTTPPVDAFICALDAASDTCCYEPQEIISAVKKAFPSLKDHVITKSEVERRLRILDARTGLDYFKLSSVTLGLQNINKTGAYKKALGETAGICTSSTCNDQDAAEAAVVAAHQTVISQERGHVAEGKDNGRESGKEDCDNMVEEDSRGVRHGLAIHSISVASSSLEESIAVAEKERADDVTFGLGSGRSTIRKVTEASASSPAVAARIDHKAKIEKGLTRIGLREWLNEIGGVGDGLELSRAVKHGLAMQFSPGNKPLETLTFSPSATSSFVSGKKPETNKESVDHRLPLTRCFISSVSKSATSDLVTTTNEQKDSDIGVDNAFAAATGMINDSGDGGSCGFGGSSRAISVHNDKNKATPATSRLWQSQTSRRVSRDADFKVHLRSSIVYRASSSSSSSSCSAIKDVNNDKTCSSCSSCANRNNSKNRISGN